MYNSIGFKMIRQICEIINMVVLNGENFMKKILILVSGMPATGKTTFAKWLSCEMCIPLVCYDHIKEKTRKIAKAECGNAQQDKLFGRFPYEFFLFNIEEIMKSSSLLIAEYFFSDLMKSVFDELVEKYQYETIMVHMDASAETVYHRFIERNKRNQRADGNIRPHEISFDQFSGLTKQNKDFRYGDRIICVDTNNFLDVSYEDIGMQIRRHIKEIDEVKQLL